MMNQKLETRTRSAAFRATIGVILAISLSLAPLATAGAAENPAPANGTDAASEPITHADGPLDAWDFFAQLPHEYGTDAISVLDNSPLADDTHKGSESDATSLSNMKESIQWLKKCNALRAVHDLPALKVNYTLMAIAMTDANYSLTHIEHAKVFNVGENLSWGNPDPFSAWYDDEKRHFEAGTQPDGHFLNIINPLHKSVPNAVTYTTTGFAIADGGMYGIEHAQVFGSETSTPGLRTRAAADLTLGDATKNGTVSVEDYEKELDSFIEDNHLNVPYTESESSQVINTSPIVMNRQPSGSGGTDDSGTENTGDGQGGTTNTGGNTNAGVTPTDGSGEKKIESPSADAKPQTPANQQGTPLAQTGDTTPLSIMLWIALGALGIMMIAWSQIPKGTFFHWPFLRKRGMQDQFTV